MRKDILRALGMISQIGISMLVPILGCILIGAYLDKHFDTDVVFLIIFTILGVGAAFRTLYMMTAYQYRDKDKNKKSKGNDKRDTNDKNINDK